MSVTTAKFHDSEISKADDFNYSAASALNVLHSIVDGAFSEVVKSFVIAGLSVHQATPASMNIVVSPGLAYSRKEDKLLHLESDLIVSVAPADPSLDRIDTVEARFFNIDIDPEVRAFKDPVTGAVSYANVYTKVQSAMEVRVVSGTPGAGVAPNVDAGWMKLAEVMVAAGATQLITSTIRGITAQLDAAENAAWTVEKADTFVLGSVSALKSLLASHTGSTITSSATVHGIRQGHGNGLDADKVDGVEAARIIYGSGARGSTVVTDFNTIIKSGFYYGLSTAIGAPDTGNSWYCLHHQYPSADNYAFQLFVGTAALMRTYVRQNINGVWGAAVKLWNASNDGAGSGLDADMVDGIESAQIIYGQSSYGTTDSVDANTIVKSGFYRLKTPYANGPTTNKAWFIVHTNSPDETTYATQIALRANERYIRTQENGTWAPWEKLWTSGNDGSGSGLDADLLDGKHLDADHGLTPDEIPLRDASGLVRNPLIDLRTGLVGAWASDLPEYPDNAAGTQDFNDLSASLGIWTTQRCTPGTFGADGVTLTVTAASAKIENQVQAIDKTVKIKIKTSRATRIQLADGSGVTLSYQDIPANTWTIVSLYGAGTINRYQVFFMSLIAGDTAQLQWIYIGDGTYSTTSRDISGGGKHGTVVGSTPTSDGGFLRDGINDYEKTVDVVTMPDVFHYHEEWEIPNHATNMQIIAGISVNTTSGRLLITRDINGRALNLYYYNGTATIIHSVANFFEVDATKIVADITITWATGALKVSRNGLPYYSGTLIGAVKPADMVWFFGNQVALASTQYCGGKVKGRRWYSRALTTAEIWEYSNNPDAYRFDDSIHAVTAVPNAIPILTSEGYLAAAQMKATDILGKMTATDILNKVKEVDGEGSGLDADKLKGRDFIISEPGFTKQIGTAFDPSPGTNHSHPCLTKLNYTDFAFSESSASFKLQLLRWDGNTWSKVGEVFMIRINDSGVISALSNTDVASVGIHQTTGVVTLSTYRWSGSAWSQIGSELTFNVGYAYSVKPSITALNSTDIAYIDNYNFNLRVYRWSGSAWSQIGSGLTISGGNRISITALNSTDIAYVDTNNESLRVYRWSGSAWSQIGSELTVVPGPSSVGITALNSTDIAYIDYPNLDLRSYRWSGSAWSQVGVGFPLLPNTSQTTIAIAAFDRKKVVVCGTDTLKVAQLEINLEMV